MWLLRWRGTRPIWNRGGRSPSRRPTPTPKRMASCTWKRPRRTPTTSNLCLWKLPRPCPKIHSSPSGRHSPSPLQQRRLEIVARAVPLLGCVSGVERRSVCLASKPCLDARKREEQFIDAIFGRSRASKSDQSSYHRDWHCFSFGKWLWIDLSSKQEEKREKREQPALLGYTGTSMVFLFQLFFPNQSTLNLLGPL